MREEIEPDQSCKQEVSEMGIYEVATSRRSIRRFKDIPVPHQILERRVNNADWRTQHGHCLQRAEDGDHLRSVKKTEEGKRAISKGP